MASPESKRARVGLQAFLAVLVLALPVRQAAAAPACGNGLIEAGEACDDGNLTAGDGCGATCQIEQQCYDAGNTFSFFAWSDSYTSAGDSGVMNLFRDAVNAARYPTRVIPRFWISVGDIPYMSDGPTRLDDLNNQISNSPGGQRYPFTCSASNGRFPYYVALGNHDVDGYELTTPESQYDYWRTVVGPKLPTTLVGIKNFRFGPNIGRDDRTTYSFDYKNAHFVVLNQYHRDPTFPSADPLGCIRPELRTWLEQDLIQNTRPIKFVFGHEPAWPYCSTMPGSGGEFCPLSNPDNQNPPQRPRPHSNKGPWEAEYGRHWGDSLSDARCPAGSRDAFWSLLGQHNVIAHVVGHTHAYGARLVRANGTPRNDISAYNKGGASFSSSEGIWEVDTGQAHNSAGAAYVLVTVRDNQVTFEAFDQVGSEPFQRFESWTVQVGTAPSVALTSPSAGTTFDQSTAIPLAATASDSDGSITQVAFYDGNTLIGTDTTSPYALNWTGAAAGSHALNARATDNSGLTTTSASVSITVTPRANNREPVLAAIGNRQADEGVALTFTAAASDPDGDPLTFTLAGGPAGATLNAATGAFQWTPSEAQGPGTYSMTVRVADNGGPVLADEETFTVTVREVNQAPALAAIGSREIDERVSFSFTATAPDPDAPANAVTLSLINLPSGATFNAATGQFEWTPSEAQGPGSYSFTVRATDNGSPALSSEETVTLTVRETNRPPVLGVIGNRSVDEGAPLAFTATATDPDRPLNSLSFSLVDAPAGAAIDAATGAFQWTPSEAQGPGTPSFTVRVTDGGSPAMTDDETITVTVREANVAPVLAPIGNRQVVEGTELTFTASATDADVPANTLSYSLVGAPTGASIGAANGVFRWTPTAAQGPATYTFTVRVSDGMLTGQEQITVTVTEPTGSNTAPVLAAIGNRSVNEGAGLSFTAAASDAEGGPLSYSLVGAPAGASIGAASGAFQWTPSEAQGPGSHTFTVRVTDSGGLSDDEAVTVTVAEINTAPVLAAIGNRSVGEGSELTFTAAAADADLPANALAFSLVGAPTGASINAASGVFRWTPSAAQGPATYTFTVRVADSGSPALSDEESITVTVQEGNRAPVIAAIGNRSADEGAMLSFTVSATDPDGDPVSFSLVAAPSGASIGVNGAFQWRPSEVQGPGSYTITVRATDNGTLSDEESFTATVAEVNTAPVLAAIGNRSVDEGSELTFTAAAADADVPANALTFSLGGAPAGASIDASGFFRWTPSEAQGPGSYTFTVRVSDGGSPALSDEESITVTVAEANAAPVLAAIGNKTTAVGQSLSFTAAAQDADVPANTLSFSLAGAPAGATINGQTGAFNWTPGAGQVGTHSFTVRVSDGTATDEETIAVTVTSGGAAADLIVSALTSQREVIRPGGSFNIDNTVDNRGAGSAGTFRVSFHLSVDDVYGGGDDVALPEARTIASLAAGGSSQALIELTVPATTPLGGYHVCVAADSEGQVPEANEANNTRCTEPDFLVTLPDLIMLSVEPETATVPAGGDLWTNDRVANQGPIRAPQSRVGYRLSSNTVWGDDDDILIPNRDRRRVEALAPGTSDTGRIDLSVPDWTPPGAYHVCAIADVVDNIDEISEENNTRCSVSKVVVLAP